MPGAGLSASLCLMGRDITVSFVLLLMVRTLLEDSICVSGTLCDGWVKPNSAIHPVELFEPPIIYEVQEKKESRAPTLVKTQSFHSSASLRLLLLACLISNSGILEIASSSFIQF